MEQITTINETICDKVICIDEEIIIDNFNDDEKGITDELESEKVEQITEERPRDITYNWNKPPKLLTTAIEDFETTEFTENFTKGCHWSPDGTCLLVPAADFRLRIYELSRELYSGEIPTNLSSLSPWNSALKFKEGGLIYDSCWYPLMNSWEPSTCCFISTSKETPIHLWDAFTGELRATYRAYNQVDEVEAAMSVAFIDNGNIIWSGFKGFLRSFDTNRPGRHVEEIKLKNDFPNVHGIVSCIRDNPMMPGLMAFGTYSKCIGLYKDGPICSLKTGNGVTQIEFSPCGTKLYSTVRRSNEFLCWDLRNPGIILYSLEKRQSNTNQRIQFSISADGNQIVSGGTDGTIRIWDISQVDNDTVEPLGEFKLSTDCINGVNIHKTLPILATSSGQRICDENFDTSDNSVRLWHCGKASD